MKVAIALALAGVALIVFGMVLLTTGGCRVDACPPSIQQVAFAAGLGLLGAAILRAGVPWLRAFPAGASRAERVFVGATIGLLVVAFWWWASTPHLRSFAAG